MFVFIDFGSFRLILTHFGSFWLHFYQFLNIIRPCLTYLLLTLSLALFYTNTKWFHSSKVMYCSLKKCSFLLILAFLAHFDSLWLILAPFSSISVDFEYNQAIFDIFYNRYYISHYSIQFLSTFIHPK